MGIKKGTKTAALFQSMKKNDSFIVGGLDKFLTDLSAKDEDRAFNVNAPSQIGNCKRNIFYGRTGTIPDSNFIEPRTRRIFDNGSFYHTRMQEYLIKSKQLLMDEVPLHSDLYNIQGHTDGIIHINSNIGEVGILELKSIKQENFKDLTDALIYHKEQGLTYLYCLEERRQYLRKKYKNSLHFSMDYKNRVEYYKSLYPHTKDGSKYTKEEKLQFKINQHNNVDKILFSVAKKPLTKVIFLYENKNDQSLKEFCLDASTPDNKILLQNILDRCVEVNLAVKNNKAPDREGRNKSDEMCRWCNYKIECWN